MARKEKFGILSIPSGYSNTTRKNSQQKRPIKKHPILDRVST